MKNCWNKISEIIQRNSVGSIHTCIGQWTYIGQWLSVGIMHVQQTIWKNLILVQQSLVNLTNSSENSDRYFELIDIN